MRTAFHALRYRPLYYASIGIFWGTAPLIFLNDNVFEITFVTGESMSPTLSPRYHETGRTDLVFFNKWNATSNIRRGDVVHFMNPMKPEALAVKRVIGVEGDVVVLDKRRRPRPREGPEPATARAWDEWRGRAWVPQGHVWVEGDNWRESHDSNYYGPISKSLVTGRAVAVVRPGSRFWTKPWVGFESRTRVVEGRYTEWTEGLPVELAEIREPHVPP